jgi:arginase
VKPVHLIGVPLDLGAGRRGVDMGPSAFRIAGIGDQIAALGRTLIDKGDVPSPIPETRRPADKTKKYIGEIAQVCGHLYELSLTSLDEGAIPLVLGGDHSLAAGSVAASAEWVRRVSLMPLGLIWLDAHGDMNTPSTTPSGNVHGMPLAAIMGLGPPELANIFDFSPKVKPENCVLVGIRDVDAPEKENIRKAGVEVFTMRDIDERGMRTVMEEALRMAGRGTAGYHVSLDMDWIDPEDAPGVGTPVWGGATYREAHLAMEIISDHGRMLSFEIVEVNPVIDEHNQTADLAVELTLSAFGKKIL